MNRLFDFVPVASWLIYDISCDLSAFVKRSLLKISRANFSISFAELIVRPIVSSCSIALPNRFRLLPCRLQNDITAYEGCELISPQIGSCLVSILGNIQFSFLVNYCLAYFLYFSFNRCNSDNSRSFCLCSSACSSAFFACSLLFLYQSLCWSSLSKRKSKGK